MTNHAPFDFFRSHFMESFRRILRAVFLILCLLLIVNLMISNTGNASFNLILVLMTLVSISYFLSYGYPRFSLHFFLSLTLLFLFVNAIYGMGIFALANITLCIYICLVFLMFEKKVSSTYCFFILIFFPLVGVGDLLGWWSSKAHNMTTLYHIVIAIVYIMLNIGFFYKITKTFKSFLSTLIEKNQIIDKLNANLTKIVDERTSNLKVANVELLQMLETLHRTQAQLIESSKNEHLSEIVAGVAHEINTPVGIAVTAISHLSDEAFEVDKAFKKNTLKKSSLQSFFKLTQEATSITQRNLERAAHFIQKFKELSTGLCLQDSKEVYVGEYLEEVIGSLMPELRSLSVDIYTDFECNPLANIHAFSLWQILSNLVKNSLIHGFDNQPFGKICIALEESDENIVIVYYDDGCGIPDKHMNKIYEPFFTTKRGSGGTGLGLSIIYNLVTQTLQGQLACRNRMEGGVEFRIEFPKNLF